MSCRKPRTVRAETATSLSLRVLASELRIGHCGGSRDLLCSVQLPVVTNIQFYNLSVGLRAALPSGLSANNYYKKLAELGGRTNLALIKSVLNLIEKYA